MEFGQKSNSCSNCNNSYYIIDPIFGKTLVCEYCFDYEGQTVEVYDDDADECEHFISK